MVSQLAEGLAGEAAGVLFGDEGCGADEAVDQDAGVKSEAATAGGGIGVGGEFVAVFARSGDGVPGIRFGNGAKVVDAASLSQCLQHLVGADAISSNERMKEAEIDPEDGETVVVIRHGAGVGTSLGSGRSVASLSLRRSFGLTLRTVRAKERLAFC